MSPIFLYGKQFSDQHCSEHSLHLHVEYHRRREARALRTKWRIFQAV